MSRSTDTTLKKVRTDSYYIAMYHFSRMFLLHVAIFSFNMFSYVFQLCLVHGRTNHAVEPVTSTSFSLKSHQHSVFSILHSEG